MIEAALAKLAKKRDLSRASLVKLRSTLNQAMAWKVKRRELDHNPVAGVEIPTVTEDPEERRALSVEELRALLGVLERSERYAMYLVMATLGLRPGEAAALCRDAVDLANGHVTVKRGIRVVRGRPVLVDALKNVSSFRGIAAPARVRDVLAEHIAKNDLSGTDLLFPGRVGAPLYASTVRAELTAACETAKVTRIRPVELRHTAATMMVEQMPMHVVADVLGHTTTRMLNATYRHRPETVTAADVLA